MNSKCPTVKAKAIYGRLIRIGKCEGLILIGVIFFLVVCVNFVVHVCLFWSAINTLSVVLTFYLFPLSGENI